MFLNLQGQKDMTQNQRFWWGTPKPQMPGKLVDVNGGKMHVHLEGKGDHTLVFLNGFSTTQTAYLNFKRLRKDFVDRYQLLSLDYLNYGFSSTTRKERTLENIVEEMHATIQKEVKTATYSLVGHSISGIYALAYINTYPNEVTAFIGLDTTVPEVLIGHTESELETALRIVATILKKLSLLHVIYPLTAKLRNITLTTAEDKAMEKYLVLENLFSQGHIDEQSHFNEFGLATKNMSFPAHIPVLFLLSPHENDPGDLGKDWVKLHARYLESNPNNEIVVLKGGHNIHWDAPEAVSENMKRFVDKNIPG